MKPFDEYPMAGHELIGPLDSIDNLSQGYWLDLQKRTGQTHCAYCGADLMSENHNNWWSMRVDRVISSAHATEIGIPAEFACDTINAVLCCSICYGLRSEYSAIDEPQIKWNSPRLEDFTDLRDRVFENRKRLIAERRAKENAVFENKFQLLAA